MGDRPPASRLMPALLRLAIAPTIVPFGAPGAPRQLRFQAASRTHTVFTSRPSACTAKYVRDLTGTPSRRTGPSKRPLGSMRKPPQRPGAA